jgi:TnpA family transposase
MVLEIQCISSWAFLNFPIFSLYLTSFFIPRNNFDALLGRVSKTLYLLHYVDDEDYRRRILTQLNRGESRHSLARAVFYGRRGELRQAYREGQEEQLGALGLVVNVLVLWNTYYMDAGLNYVRSLGEAGQPHKKARIL